MKTTNIYVLIDPRDQKIRYVGKTNNPEERFKGHMNRANNKMSHKRNWINQLRSNKLKPIMVIIDVVPIEEWIFWESYWISQMKTWGFSLVNHTEGGDGSTFGNISSFKKGQKPWNDGLIKIRKCIVCGNSFKPNNNNSTQKSCSNKCAASIKTSATQFNKGNIPWNKNKCNYKLGGLKKSTPVLQLDINTNEIINEFLGCKEAAIAMNCIYENIRKACAGINKTAKGYKWKYKNDIKK